MVNIQSPTAEIRRGKKEEERKKQDENIMVCHITLHRATIIINNNYLMLYFAR